MQSFYSADLKLVHKFQKGADYIHYNFGANNFKIAKLLRSVMILCFVIREIIVFIQGINITECVIIVCSAIIIYKMRFMQKKAEEVLKNNMEVMNPIMIDYALTRIIIQFVAIGGLGFLMNHLYNVFNFKNGIIITATEVKEICWDLFAILLFFVAYFNSCTPNPTNTLKTKNDVDKMKTLSSLKPLLS